MTMLSRWLMFNAVGVMGMVVQLSALALLTRWFGGRYLMATVVAIEMAVLHNFWWHWRFTWRDLRGVGGWWRQMVKFHAANGMVSMVGNLVLMRVLVSGGHVPVVVANVVAIGCCSVMNFCAGNVWAFAGEAGCVSIESDGRR